MEATQATISAVETDLSEEDALLQATVRDVLAREGAQERARAWWQNDSGFDRRTWDKLTELGITGMMAPSAAGGIDARPLAACVVAEEIGFAAAALPFEMHATALRLGGELASEDWATSGRVLATNVAAVGSRARLDRDRLTGSARLIPEAAVADGLLVAADGMLAIVTSFSAEHVATLGMNRFANVGLDDSAIQAMRPSRAGEVAHARNLATIFIAARGIGLARWMLRQSTEHAAQRIQFGRAIGSFQALQHKLAEMHIAMSASQHLVRHAATRFDESPSPELEVSRAKAFLGTTLWRVATEAHQIHGGVGFILDHPLPLYFAQARGVDSLLGNARQHHVAIGQALLSGGAHRPNLLLGVG